MAFFEIKSALMANSRKRNQSSRKKETKKETASKKLLRQPLFWQNGKPRLAIIKNLKVINF
jgi:hypothetical protein